MVVCSTHAQRCALHAVVVSHRCRLDLSSNRIRALPTPLPFATPGERRCCRCSLRELITYDTACIAGEKKEKRGLRFLCLDNNGGFLESFMVSLAPIVVSLSSGLRLDAKTVAQLSRIPEFSFESEAGRSCFGMVRVHEPSSTVLALLDAADESKGGSGSTSGSSPKSSARAPGTPWWLAVPAGLMTRCFALQASPPGRSSRAFPQPRTRRRLPRSPPSPWRSGPSPTCSSGLVRLTFRQTLACSPACQACRPLPYEVPWVLMATVRCACAVQASAAWSATTKPSSQTRSPGTCLVARVYVNDQVLTSVLIATLIVSLPAQ